MTDEAVASEFLLEELSDDELREARAAADHQTDWMVLVLCALVVTAALLLQVTGDRGGVTVGGKQLPEICTVKRMGWGECPGCGLTRSFVLGMRLSPEAFRLHPAGPLLLLVVVGQLPYRSWRLVSWWRRRRAGKPEPDPDRYEPMWRAVRWSVMLAILLGWIVKLFLRA